MIIKISVYDRNQYTKSGKLKKHAKAEMARMMVDVEPHKESDTQDFLKETAQVLKKEYHGFTSPYIFTHLEAINKETGELVLIWEEVMVGNDYIITSPIKLREYLTSN